VFRLLFSLSVLFAMTSVAAELLPPAAKRVPKKVTLHGVSWQDPYAWLREKTSPEVIQYLEAENRYTEGIMKDTEELQKQLYAEILGRIQETDLSVPARKDDYFYYTRMEKGKSYAIYCRKKGSLDAAEEVMLDANVLAEGKKYFRIGVFVVSPDHNLVAYSVDTAGDEAYLLTVKDLRTGQLLQDEVPNTYYSVEWGNDNRTLFYNVLDAAKRPYRLYRHVLGTPASDDVLVYEEPDQAFTLELSRARSGAFLLMTLGSSTTAEVRYLSTEEPHEPFRIVEPRRKGIEYSVEHQGDSFYIIADDTGRNYRLVKAPVSNPSAANWQEILPHRDDVMISDVDGFAGHLVISTLENATPRLHIRNLDSGEAHTIEFPEPVYAAALTGNREYNTRTLRFNYTSLITPASVFDYDMEARTRELKKQTEVLGGYDPSQYVSERLYATGHDGMKVPMAVVYKKGLERNGRNPALLYGYGSYGASSLPYFSSDRLSLLDRGFVFAIAQIRGGSEMGRKWHDNGKMMLKKNSFQDFVSAAEHLVALQYTSPRKLAMMGGSAGGLLMGAVLNMRPDLFGAVIAKVPFVDVINTMLDETLPLTVGEFEEWGNPKEKQYFEYMRTYSPYDNVKRRAYPHMLVTAGLNDPRVSYWEPAKWVAKLRTVKTNPEKTLLLLKTNMGAGHFGASGRYERIKETAFDYAFLLKALEVK
jgi:oligopeptidase B